MTEVSREPPVPLSGKRTAAWAALLARLKSATALQSWQPMPVVPDKVISFFRSIADPSTDDPVLQAIQNPYRYVKERLNKIWAGRAAYEHENDDHDSGAATPVAKLATLRGALTAYWTSERWAQAWLATGATVGMATLTAQNAVWIAEAYAGVMDSVAQLVNPDTTDTARMIRDSILNLSLFGGIQVGSTWSLYRLRSFIEKDAGYWIKNQFKAAALSHPDMVQRLTHNTKQNSPDPDAMPDSPHERIDAAPDNMIRNLMSLGIGGWAAAATSYFVAMALIEKSIPVPMLDRLGTQLIGWQPGEYGTAIAAAAVITAYLSATIPTGLSISRAIESSLKQLQKTGGRLTESFVKTFEQGEALAAARGHQAMNKNLSHIHDDFTQARGRHNMTMANYFGFYGAQSFIGHNMIAVLPAIAPIIGSGGRIAAESPVKTIFETQGLVSALLSALSSVIDILPSYAEMKAAGDRVAEMAGHFERVADKKAFYSLSGIHEFEETTLPPAATKDTALRLDGLELMFRGQTEPFLRAPTIDFAPGDWVHITGESGAGKSSFIKAVATLWPYGRGTVAMKEGTRLFYAHQEAYIPEGYSLAEQLLFGMEMPEGFDAALADRQRMIRALTEAGLAEYVPHLEDHGIGNKSWDQILSGGQRNRLVLARILYQQPDIILLDEPTAALHPKARQFYFDKLKEHCAGATVLAITHDEHPPRDRNGVPYFNGALHIANGTVTLTPSKVASTQDDTTRATAHNTPAIAP